MSTELRCERIGAGDGDLFSVSEGVVSWVLIVILVYGPNPIALERFPNQASCERAAEWIRDNTGFGSPRVVCLQDSK